MAFQMPKYLIQKNDKARFIALVLVFIAAMLFLESTGFLEGINNYCYNLAFRLRGESEHDNRILIAAIDEKTLANLGRWPIRRSYYADQLNYFNQAAAVGINLIFSESSQDDTQLAVAITRHGKVVLPAYIDSRFNMSAPVKALSPTAIGHVHLEQGVDGFVREIFHRISHPSVALPSFASALYEVINDQKLSRPEIQDKIPQQNVVDNIIQSNNMWINYYGAPGKFPYLSAVDILEGQWPPSFFADKIILVGTTTAGLQEGILVPFADSRSKMPAVEVHAHILNNLLDNSNIYPVDPMVRWSFVSILAIFCFLMFIRFGGLSGTFIGILILLALTLITILLFSSFNIWLAPVSLYFSVGISFLLAYFFNLQNIKKLLFEAKENWEESFNTINDAICIHDHNCNIILANKAAEQTFGPPLLELLKQRCHNQSYKNGDSNPETDPRIEAAGSTEETFHPELDRYLEIKSLPRFDKNRRFKGIVQIVRDITETKRSQKEHQM